MEYRGLRRRRHVIDDANSVIVEVQRWTVDSISSGRTRSERPSRSVVTRRNVAALASARGLSGPKLVRGSELRNISCRSGDMA